MSQRFHKHDPRIAGGFAAHDIHCHVVAMPLHSQIEARTSQ